MKNGTLYTTKNFVVFTHTDENKRTVTFPLREEQAKVLCDKYGRSFSLVADFIDGEFIIKKQKSSEEET